MPSAGQGVLSERAAQLLLNREAFAAHVSQSEVFGFSVVPKTKCLAFPFFPNAWLGVCLQFFSAESAVLCFLCAAGECLVVRFPAEQLFCSSVLQLFWRGRPVWNIASPGSAQTSCLTRFCRISGSF